MRKNYLWYQFWRYAVVRNGLKLFYSKIIIKNREKLPKNKPILFVPNHQNSFMDAFLIVTSISVITYFLTRARAFNPPIMGWFLRSLNMLPVYRVRDGFSSVQKNNAIFDECYRYLKRNQAVMIFAEANHNLKKRIRPLSKGFTRIAFGGEEKYDWELDLQVVPVGINYTAHRNSRNTIQVNFGESIPVSKYRELYKQDEKEAAELLKQEVSDSMKKLAFHVQDLGEYAAQEILWDTLEPNEQLIVDPDTANPRIAKAKPHLTEEIKEEAKELRKTAEKQDFSLRDITQGRRWSAADYLLAPFYLLVLLNNIIPYQPVRYLMKNVIKDHAFDASIKFVAGLFILPIFYGIVSIILALSGLSFPFIAAYFGISILTAPAFIRAKELFTPALSKKLSKSNPDLLKEINARLEPFRNLRQQILRE